MADKDFFTKLSDTHPFITVCTYAGQDYVGIVQNRDELVTTIYDYGSIVESVIREKFLHLGDAWWWESNRTIPINLFLKQEWDPFRTYLRTFMNKNLTIIHGPVVSISDINKRRIKRKSITLVERMP